ncbi:MAG: FAD-binding oxidoreductase [Sphingomonas taxi]
MPSITINSGVSFSADAGVPILQAGLEAGLPLAYSCKTGRCSSCMCKIVAGETLALHAEIGLTASEREAGWVLSCVRTAVTDVVVDLDILTGITLPGVRTLPCRIDTIDYLSSDVIGVKLRFPPSADFRYIPGQYVQIIGPGGMRRSYSIANAVTGEGIIELHIRAVDGGAMSRYWFEQARPNDLLRLCGPLGTFFLRDVAGKDVVFLATGTGIAPVKAMLEAMADIPDERAPQSVTVCWGGRIPEDIYIDMSGVPAVHRFVPTLSRADSAWLGDRGYVQDAFLRTHPDLAHTVVYACGSEAMIHQAKDVLTTMGLPSDRFHSDAFVCSASS